MGENRKINVHDSIIHTESNQIILEEISRYFKKNIRWLLVLAGLAIINSFSSLILIGIFNSFCTLSFKDWYSVPINLVLNAIMFLVGLRAITKVEKIIRG
jgi:hypothetical protein